MHGPQPQSGKGNKAFLEERCEGLPRGMEGWHTKQAWSEEGVMHVHLRGSGEGMFLAPGKALQPHCCYRSLSALRGQLTPHWVKEPKEGRPRALS